MRYFKNGSIAFNIFSSSLERLLELWATLDQSESDLTPLLELLELSPILAGLKKFASENDIELTPDKERSLAEYICTDYCDGTELNVVMLGWAANKGHIEIVKNLINSQDYSKESLAKHKKTILSDAVEGNQQKVVKLLLPQENIYFFTDKDQAFNKAFRIFDNKDKNDLRSKGFIFKNESELDTFIQRTQKIAVLLIQAGATFSQELFIESIKKNHVRIVRAMLQQQPRLANYEYLSFIKTQTVLNYAIGNKLIEMADALLAAGADVTLTDSRQITTLMTAIENQMFGLAILLIEKCSQDKLQNFISSTNQDGKDALYLAIRAGSETVALKLIECIDANSIKKEHFLLAVHPQAHQSVLSALIDKCNASAITQEVLEAMIENNYNRENVSKLINKIGISRLTLRLNRLSQDNALDFITLLVEQNANLNTVLDTETIKSAFSDSKKYKVGLKILEGHFDPNLPVDRETPSRPLDLAVKAGNLQLVQALINKGAEVVYYFNHRQEIPLNIALKNNKEDIAKALLDKMNQEQRVEALKAADKSDQTTTLNYLLQNCEFTRDEIKEALILACTLESDDDSYNVDSIQQLIQAYVAGDRRLQDVIIEGDDFITWAVKNGQRDFVQECREQAAAAAQKMLGNECIQDEDKINHSIIINCIWYINPVDVHEMKINGEPLAFFAFRQHPNDPRYIQLLQEILRLDSKVWNRKNKENQSFIEYALSDETLYNSQPNPVIEFLNTHVNPLRDLLSNCLNNNNQRLLNLLIEKLEAHTVNDELRSVVNALQSHEFDPAMQEVLDRSGAFHQRRDSNGRLVGRDRPAPSAFGAFTASMTNFIAYHPFKSMAVAYFGCTAISMMFGVNIPLVSNINSIAKECCTSIYNSVSRSL